MKRSILCVAFLLAAAAGTAEAGLSVSWETPCSLEATWQPVRIDAVKVMETGTVRLALSRGFPFDTEAWTVEVDRDGFLHECYDSSPGGSVSYSTSMDGGSGEVLLTATGPGGDVLWTCSLEGTDDFSNYQQIAELPDGCLIVNSRPDCSSIYTDLHLISPSGDLLWHTLLGTDYLLGLDAPIGETSADVSGMAGTSSGDILLCGSVRQFLTSPSQWFVCLLDGSTGETEWTATGSSLGEAALLDVTELSNGSVAAVGQTASSVVPEGMAYSVWGARQPLAVMLDGNGNVSGEVVFDPGSIASFQAVREYESGDDYAYDSVTPPIEFLVAGADTIYDELALLKLELSR